MKATEESIQNLIKNASLAVKEMYPALKQDMAIMQACDDSVSAILRLVVEMRMNVKFILIDLETAFRALISANSAVEKRLQLKNLRADMHESYKLLYGFGNVQRHTAWYKIGADLSVLQSGDADDIYTILRSVYDAITVAIEQIGIADKENRDLTYHYDDDLLKVYQNILEANDEEDSSRQLISVFDLLKAILLFCNQVELVEKLKGHSLPDAADNGVSLLFVQKLLAEKLSENGKLQDALGHILTEASRVDQAASMRKGIVRIKEFAKDKLPKGDFPEADDMDNMANLQLLLQIALVDMASIVSAYLKSGSDPEYALNLRRLTITRVSTLSHLYGYNDFVKSKSLWSTICAMIPETDRELNERSVSIRDALDALINPNDKDVRTLYAHLMDKKDNNIPKIIAQIEEVNPVAELKKAEGLIVITSKIQVFLKDLMDRIGRDAHARAEASTARFLAQIKSIRDLADNPKCPESLKTTINEQMDVFEKIAQGDFSILKRK